MEPCRGIRPGQESWGCLFRYKNEAWNPPIGLLWPKGSRARPACCLIPPLFARMDSGRVRVREEKMPCDKRQKWKSRPPFHAPKLSRQRFLPTPASLHRHQLRRRRRHGLAAILAAGRLHPLYLDARRLDASVSQPHDLPKPLQIASRSIRHRAPRDVQRRSRFWNVKCKPSFDTTTVALFTSCFPCLA